MDRIQKSYFISDQDAKRLNIKSENCIIICNQTEPPTIIGNLIEELQIHNKEINFTIINEKILNSLLAEEKFDSNIKNIKSDSPQKHVMILPIAVNQFKIFSNWQHLVTKIRSENKFLQKMINDKYNVVLCHVISEKSSNFEQFLHQHNSTIAYNLNVKNNSVKSIIRVSNIIYSKEIQNISTFQEQKRYLVTRLKLLETSTKTNKLKNIAERISNNKILPEVIKPISIASLEKEIKALRLENKVLEWNEFELFLADFNKMPNCMLEIGRLREITFRNAQEGSGLTIDLDSYDPLYKHLFIWDKTNLKIVGAYRIGEGHNLIPGFGKKGFYISTLFKIKNEFIPVLAESVELGRSFIIPEYQKSNHLLMLMWKVLFEYIISNPKNRYIIGPVSISEAYSKISRLLIVDYMTKYYLHNEFNQYIKPRKPFRYIEIKKTETIIVRNFEHDITKFDQLISEIQANGMKLPVLLRQYIKQNAKVLAFNRDPKFQNVLDSLLILDCQEINPEFKQLIKLQVNHAD
ncbi:MAG TPA: GNAT family N-acetyltransferase [Saprospiraceae bacterium]|nr:GNAT family N-acetyltransferase [Saprospiraceae bacterium]